MQIADAWLYHDKDNWTPLKGITPAEALYLDFARKRHKDDKEPKIRHIKVVGEVKRSSSEEKERLGSRYGETDRKTGDLLLEKCFPGQSPTLPDTFKTAGYEEEAQPKEGKLLHYPALTDGPSTEEVATEDIEALRDEVAQLKGALKEVLSALKPATK